MLKEYKLIQITIRMLMSIIKMFPAILLLFFTQLAIAYKKKMKRVWVKKAPNVGGSSTLDIKGKP